MAKTKTAQSGTSSNSVVPGQYYGLPGLTQFFELDDSQVGVVVTGAQASATNVNTLSQLAQDNIVFWWEMDVSISQTYTVGTGGETTSPYMPWSYLASVELSLQSMYTSVNVDNGIDLLIFDLIRPMRGFRAERGDGGTNPAENAYASGPPVVGVPYAGGVNANLFATPTPTAAMSAINFTAVIPGSVFIDEYWDMDMDGTLLSNIAVPATVSPQYMAGAARQVTPKVQLASGSVSDLSTGPYNLTGNATITFTASFSMRRVGLYSTENPATDPPVYSWQYQRISKSYGATVSTPLKIKLDEYAQILSLFFRLWDPTLNGGVGGSIAITNIAKMELQYGGSLLRFSDTPKTMQRRFYQQHGLLLPAGVLAWDLALDPDQSGKVTNAYALNTLVSASCTVIVTWASGYTPGAGSKIVVGYEEFKYVIPQ
jgi:hypothetical protein